MPRAFDNDLRARVIADCLSEELSARAAAKKYRVSASTAIKWVLQARQGQYAAGKQGRPHGSRLDSYASFISNLLDEKSDMTLDEMKKRLFDECHIEICRSGLDIWLRSRGWTFKKKRYPPANNNVTMSYSNAVNGRNINLC